MAGRILREKVRAATLLLLIRRPLPATRPLPVARRPAIRIGLLFADALNHPQPRRAPAAQTIARRRLKRRLEERTRTVRIWLTASRRLRMNFNRLSSPEFLQVCSR